MRTTIEMRDEHRARLLELAARRGEKGFSHLVEEAIELYLRQEEVAAERRERALAVRGSFTDEEAEELRREIRRVREHWR